MKHRNFTQGGELRAQCLGWGITSTNYQLLLTICICGKQQERKDNLEGQYEKWKEERTNEEI